MSYDVSIPPWAVRGAQVVCITPTWDLTDFNDPDGRFTWPEFGQVFTIRKVEIRYSTESGGYVAAGLLLEEIVNPICDGGSGAGMETTFDVACFRPVQRVKAEVKQRVEEPA